MVAAKRQGLFAKQLLSRGSRGDHLGAMQRMRRRQQHRVNGGIVEDGIKTAGEVDLAVRAKTSRPLDVDLDGTGDLEAIEVAGGIDQTAAPAAKACDGAV